MGGPGQLHELELGGHIQHGTKGKKGRQREARSQATGDEPHRGIDANQDQVLF